MYNTDTIIVQYPTELRTEYDHVAGSPHSGTESPYVVPDPVQVTMVLTDLSRICWLLMRYDLGEIMGFDAHSEVIIPWLYDLPRCVHNFVP